MEKNEFKKLSKEVLDKIEKADKITVFRHILPDWDAVGSQSSMKKWLELNYPEKEVVMVGVDYKMPMDQAEDDFIKDSLGIILDTSTAERVDDERWKSVKDLIRLDHHIQVETIAPLEIIDTKASATCELLSLFFKEAGKPIDKEIAQTLYHGLIADNLGFTTNNVTPATFEAAAYLRENGADPVKANIEIFGNDYDQFAFDNVVREKSFRKNNFLYSIITAQDYLSKGVSYDEAKKKVYLLGDFLQIECWALFVMSKDGTHFNGSLRSRTIPVRDIAEEYGGGGHDCAAGLRALTIEQVQEVIEKMAARSLEKESE